MKNKDCTQLKLKPKANKQQNTHTQKIQNTQKKKQHRTSVYSSSTLKTIYFAH